jgi:uncharacterized membrane protein YbaN (DUF454 family)
VHIAPVSEAPAPQPRSRKTLHPAARWALDIAGVVFLTIGTIGIFVPYWPTTVFWIVAVICFLKTRPGAVRPLLRTPIVGPAIRWFLRWKPFRRKKS